MWLIPLGANTKVIPNINAPSKRIMADFWYNKILPTFKPEKVRLLYSGEEKLKNLKVVTHNFFFQTLTASMLFSRVGHMMQCWTNWLMS